MIKAVFMVSGDKVVGFDLSGHAGTAESGQDVLCAAVSGATQCVNAVIEDAMELEGSFSVEEGKNNRITCDLSPLSNVPESAFKVLKGFMLTMEMWEEDFPQNIKVKRQHI
jgi:uncharacterized protein YsxB (DUF464 family)